MSNKTENKKEVNTRLPKKGRPVKKSRLAKAGRDKIMINPRELAFIEAKADEGLSLMKIKAALKKEFNKSLSHTTIGTILKESGYKKPVVTKSRIPVEYIFMLRYDKRNTLEEISGITGMNITTLEYHLKKEENQKLFLSTKLFTENKLAAFEGKQFAIFDGLTKSKIAAMSARDIVSAVSQFENLKSSPVFLVNFLYKFSSFH